VLQWAIAYLGAALALAHGQELLAHTFHWPELIGRLVMGSLVVGFPIAIVLAWYHGHKGLSRVTAGEMTVLAVLLLAGGAALTLLTRGAHTSAEGASATQPQPVAGSERSTPQTIPRLAILPFENLSPDPANAFFADGLHEEIVSTLARRGAGLEVVSRITMLTYRGQPKPARDIAHELGVTHLIEGSVRREARQVRLTLQLIDARTDKHIWSQNYDRALDNALTLQSEVADQVASQLSVQLAARGAGPAPTQDAEAYDLYLKARLSAQQTNPYIPESELRNVERLLTQALARDPRFALAYVERTSIRLGLFAGNYDTSQAHVDRITADLAAAKSLAPDDPNVLAAEAYYQAYVQQDNERALATFAAASVAGLADPTWLMRKTFLLMREGHFDEAIALMERVTTLDPGNSYVNGVASVLFNSLGQPREALRFAERGIALGPGRAVLPLYYGVIVWGHTGDVTSWRRALDRFGDQLDEASRLEYQFNLLRFEHRYEDLRKELDGVTSQSIRVTNLGNGIGNLSGVGDRPLSQYRGWTYLLLGNKQAAAQAGKVTLQFLQRRQETLWNKWSLRTMAAEAYALTQDCAKAREIAADNLRASEGRANLSNSRAGGNRRLIAISSARVYAWCGSADEAIELLEELASLRPPVQPALLTRDPLYAVPLARNSRYRTLATRIEAQLAATKLPPLRLEN